MKTVTILRGISGAGKSTYTRENFPNATVCSADNFFMQNGVYNWDASKLGRAHDWCLNTFNEALRRNDSSIVVDNTNTKLREFKRYRDEALMYGYEVNVVRLVVDPAIAAARNLHGVPADKVQAMQDRFQDFQGELIVDTTPVSV
jgi:predicted kinase